MKPSIRPDAGVVERDLIRGVCRQEVNGLDSDADDEQQGGSKAKCVKDVYLPSQLELEEHE